MCSLFPTDLAEFFSSIQVIKPESNDKEAEGADESDLPEELCGHQLPQQTVKNGNDGPDVVLEAPLGDSDSEEGHGSTHAMLIDGVKVLSVCGSGGGECCPAVL